ncbi:hypothetical protein WR25_25930 isoform A [Diploscapter pachys]|uniref:Neurotransmitter-gated ion-channel ligand-binding domain-containing protein n=2 Tax=Diploscapter pachys TaxID=2018661 RepID=A0A2A2KSA2_9BILA|nr:hypothetical protein WR25_25930 isoform A [Diploscapter pachys]
MGCLSTSWTSLPISLFLLLMFIIARQYALETEDEQINTMKLSEVLDKLINNATYDKRLRPNYGGKPVDVGITIHVSSISAVSEVDMDFTLDFYMRQTWQDPRLAFGEVDLGLPNKISSLTVGVDYLDKLWKPDTFFPNEKRSFFHVATTHNSFLRIDKDGTVYTSQRLTVTATCSMKLQLFPMDSQRCKLEIESYAYSTDEIAYYWCSRDNNNCTGIKKEEIELPSYAFDDRNICMNRTVFKNASGSYSRLIVTFIFDRESGFYMLQIFLPSGLVVVISWVSFWINRDSAPSRTIIGVMTILTETHLMTGTNRRLPPVSYIKAVDVYLGFSYLLVVLALIEYAFVAYTKKKNEDRKRKEKRMGGGSERRQPIQTPAAPDIVTDARLAECTCNSMPVSIIAVMQKKEKYCLRHSHIDIGSRFFFPLTFTIFNLLFWIILLAKAKRLPFFSDIEQFRCINFPFHDE